MGINVFRQLSVSVHTTTHVMFTGNPPLLRVRNLNFKDGLGHLGIICERTAQNLSLLTTPTQTGTVRSVTDNTDQQNVHSSAIFTSGNTSISHVENIPTVMTQFLPS